MAVDPCLNLPEESYSGQRKRKSVWQGFLKDLWNRVWQTLQAFIYTQLYAAYNLTSVFCP